MRVLDRKLLRDLRAMKGQVLAIVLIVACGVASFVTVLSAYRGLESTRDAYYGRYRMADVFAPLKRAPRSVAHELEAVAGVRRVDARIVFDVTLDLPRLGQPASGRVVSVPVPRRPILNDLHLTRGHWFEGDGTREVIVADRFARAHHLEVGDTLRVVMNNKKEALRIVGMALSPEFIYLIRGAGDLLPDPMHFTVLWMSDTFAEAVFDMKEACNDFVALLDPGADVESVVAAFDRILDRYGCLGSYARKDQLSNRLVHDEIEGLKGQATFLPAIFLGVAAFVLHMLMGRLVGTQRTQIGLLRAFGYPAGDLVRHYLRIALAVGVLGALVGTGLGLWFARYILGIYREFYDFPLLDFAVDPVAILLGWAMSLGFAAMGALGAVRAVARMDPAAAMQPEAPRLFHRALLERLPGLWRRLGFTTRMVLRNLSRNRLRAVIATTGVGLAASLLLVSFYAVDAMNELMDVQFRLVERQDVQVAFHDEKGRSALYEIARLPGVRRAEPELTVAVRFHNGRYERRGGLSGIPPGMTLRALLDEDLRHVPPPREGLLLSSKLAELLHVRVGDDVEVEVLTGKKQRFRAPVEAVVDEYLGLGAYAPLGRLSRWIDEEEVLTGARLSVDPLRSGDVGRALKEVPAVAAVSFKARTVQSFRDTVAQSQGILNTVLVLFAGIITFGVVYNTARIALSERARELGTLRVLGYSSREVERVLESENVLVTTLALLPGLALGVWFCHLLTTLYDTDLFRFPFVMRAESFFWTILIVFVFTGLANLLVRRKVRALDIIEVLKARE